MAVLNSVQLSTKGSNIQGYNFAILKIISCFVLIHCDHNSVCFRAESIRNKKLWSFYELSCGRADKKVFRIVVPNPRHMTGPLLVTIYYYTNGTHKYKHVTNLLICTIKLLIYSWIFWLLK